MADRSTQSLEMAGALSACRDVLLHGLEGGADLESLREPLRALSSCARREHLPAERVLVEVKQLLHDLRAYSTMPPSARDALRGLVVKMVVAAYYGDERQ